MFILYINGNNYIGGLIGVNEVSARIYDSYSFVNVDGDTYIGGFVGFNGLGTVIKNCYSTGIVNGNSDYVGGFMGNNHGLVQNCFWNTETSEQDTSAEGLGKTTDQMKTMSTYFLAGWDFKDEKVNGLDDYWGINDSDNNGLPFLSWQGYQTDYMPVITTVSDVPNDQGRNINVTWDKSGFDLNGSYDQIVGYNLTHIVHFANIRRHRHHRD